jgi:hypothetical protein
VTYTDNTTGYVVITNDFAKSNLRAVTSFGPVIIAITTEAIVLKRIVLTQRWLSVFIAMKSNR